MYTPAYTAETRPERLHQLVREFPLGQLVTHGPQGLDANVLPFLLDVQPDGSAVLRAHAARANPVWRECAGTQVMALFQGPQAYVSPNWYPSKAEDGRAVPTWNYIVVQAHGPLVVHDDVAWMRQFLTRLTARHEAAQPRPWRLEDAPPGYLDAMLRGVVGLEIPVASWQGKWKMSQNHPQPNRDGVARGLRERGDDQARAVADWVERAAPR